MKKILITGAAGDIGTRLVQALSTKSDVVLYTTALQNLHYSVNSTHRNFDVRDPLFLQWVKEIKPDVVVHLASIIRLPDTMNESEAYEIDVTATERLLAICAEIGVDKFVVTSSGAAYGYW